MTEIVCAANCLECEPDRSSLNADWLEVSTLYYYAHFVQICGSRVNLNTGPGPGQSSPSHKGVVVKLVLLSRTNI